MMWTHLEPCDLNMSVGAEMTLKRSEQKAWAVAIVESLLTRAPCTIMERCQHLFTPAELYG